MSDLPDLNRRIFEVIQDTTSGNVADFARNIGLEQQKIDRLNKIDRRNNKFPAPSQIIIDSIIEGVPTLNRVWLLTGVGEKYDKIIARPEKESDQVALLRSEIRDLKKELQKQTENNRELLGKIIDYLDKKVEPIYDYMTELSQKKQKENI